MLLERMNYLEVEQYLTKNDTVLLVTGSTENHGKHMPLGTDTLIPEKIAAMAEALCPDEIVVAPALPYGCTEDLRGFAGTLSLGSEGLRMVLTLLCDQLFDYGFRHFLILNGHGGNSKTIEQVGLHMYERGARLARLDWWLLAGQINPAWKGGHGGGEETAGVMAVDPTLIKTEYINEGENIRNDLGDALPSGSWTNVVFHGAQVTVPRPVHDITDNGWLVHTMGPDAPTRANAEWGTEMLETMAQFVCDFARTFRDVKMP